MVKLLDEDCWEPLSLKETCDLFEPAPFFWCLGGGYAIELFVGRQYRAHEDVDLLIWRDELPSLRDFLKEWEVYASDPPGHLRYWAQGEELGAHVHDIWVRALDTSEWRFQIMVMDRDQKQGCDQWLFRRDPSVRRSVEDVICESSKGVKYLAPHIQLLFKSKSMRDKDIQDFEKALPCMNNVEKRALKELLQGVYNSEHPWIEVVKNSILLKE